MAFLHIKYTKILASEFSVFHIMGLTNYLKLLNLCKAFRVCTVRKCLLLWQMVESPLLFIFYHLRAGSLYLPVYWTFKRARPDQGSSDSLFTSTSWVSKGYKTDTWWPEGATLEADYVDLLFSHHVDEAIFFG